MAPDDKVNILLVDDQPSKLLTYEVILRELGHNLIKAESGQQALECLLKNEIALVLMDVCMPEVDGFQLASMIREHPRFQKIAMIFISAIHLAEIDHLRGYEMGAVDYVPVPVVPDVLRAKVRVFTDLYRKGRELERLNAELEKRVAERTADLEASTMRLVESEQRRSLALAAGDMGSWDWDLAAKTIEWDEGQHAIHGVVAGEFAVTPENLRVLVFPDDWSDLQKGFQSTIETGQPNQAEFRVRRPDGAIRWCTSSVTATRDNMGKVVRIGGVTMDITERKDAEERQSLLAREVDHRAKNAMAIVQAILRLTKATSIEEYSAVVEGRVKALSRTHAILSDSRWQGAELRKLVEDELMPYGLNTDRIKVSGPEAMLDPTTAQTMGLALHELATNAAKYGALSQPTGYVDIGWTVSTDAITIEWRERGGPVTSTPKKNGFGTRIITSSIEHQLKGTAVFDWREDGLSCKLAVPRKQGLGLRSDGHAGQTDATSKILSGRRIMIVEDEALVSMGLESQLEELGLSVIAACANVPDAMKAIDRESPDSAILDVNLGGQLVYPVADRLIDLGIPFIFVSGYGRESVDRRYDAFQVLEKPIERKALAGLFASASTAS